MVEQKSPVLAETIDMSQIAVVIVYLILIIIGAYFLTRFVAQRRLQQGMRTERKMGGIAGWGRPKDGRPQPGHMVSVVDRIVIDREKTLMVVEFEGSYFLIGTTARGFKYFDKVPVPTVDADGDAADAQAETVTVSVSDTNSEDGETFGQRFRRAFSIVLESYLPRGVREKRAQQRSFDEELKARMQASRKDNAKKDSEEPKE